MLYCVACGSHSITLELYASNRHGGAIVISEVKGQSLSKIERENNGILSLMMDMNMRLAGIAGVATFTDHLSLFNGLACRHDDTSFFQVCDDQIRPCFQLDNNMVSSGGFKIA